MEWQQAQNANSDIEQNRSEQTTVIKKVKTKVNNNTSRYNVRVKKNTDSNVGIYRNINNQQNNSINVQNDTNGFGQNVPANKNNKVQTKTIYGSNLDTIKVLPQSGTEDYLRSRIVKEINDPYVIKVNKIKYYFVFEAKNNIYTLNNIVGYGDTHSSLFYALKQLNKDNDITKLTSQELKQSNIRLVAMYSNKLMLHNKNLDFDLSKIKYIDIKNTRESVNNGVIGSFGYFDAYILNNSKVQKIVGTVTFESDEELLELIK